MASPYIVEMEVESRENIRGRDVPLCLPRMFCMGVGLVFAGFVDLDELFGPSPYIRERDVYGRGVIEDAQSPPLCLALDKDRGWCRGVNRTSSR